MEYPITRDYIRFGNSRSGQKISKVRFIVSHDTGNPGSTAYGNRNYFDRSQPTASAHTFIDDKYVLEIIPLTEKAWHVRYNVTADNQRFGDDANDAAIGVELCHGGRINFQEAYKRYVWYHAYLCDKFNLDPKRHIVAHSALDPSRRDDPIPKMRYAHRVFLGKNLLMMFKSHITVILKGFLQAIRHLLLLVFQQDCQFGEGIQVLLSGKFNKT